MLVVTEAQSICVCENSRFCFFSFLASLKSIEAAVGNTIALLGGSGRVGHCPGSDWSQLDRTVNCFLPSLVSLHSTFWYCAS